MARAHARRAVDGIPRPRQALAGLAVLAALMSGTAGATADRGVRAPDERRSAGADARTSASRLPVRAVSSSIPGASAGVGRAAGWIEPT